MLWDIYEQHLEEAAFLWSQWERALVAPDYLLDEVAPLEERLHAHVDGLVLGEEAPVKRLLLPALESDDPELIRVAGYTLLMRASPGDIGAVRERLESADEAALAALQRAMEVLDPAMLPTWLPSLLQTDAPTLQALGLEVLGFHRMAPAAACQALATHEVPGIAAAALRAAGHCRIGLTPAMLERALASPSAEVRDAALEVGVLGGHRAAWAACREALQSEFPASSLPLLLLSLRGDDRDLKQLLALLSQKTLRAALLWALGFSGRVACADACLEFLHQKPFAALAAEAFSAITGLPIQGPYAARSEEVEVEEPIPLEKEDLDADLVPNPEDDLVQPQADAIRAWWKEARPRMELHRRYLEGQPFSPLRLVEALQSSSMRRRHVLALEVALRSRGAHQMPTRAFVERQLEGMRAARAAPPMRSGFVSVGECS